MKRFVYAIALAVSMTAVTTMLAGCTNETEARSVLAAQGFTNVVITGYDWFGCGKEDFDHTGFTATGVNGQKVKGVVCGGLFKGATVRFN